jgi:hypothetical protein
MVNVFFFHAAAVRTGQCQSEPPFITATGRNPPAAVDWDTTRRRDP